MDAYTNVNNSVWLYVVGELSGVKIGWERTEEQDDFRRLDLALDLLRTQVTEVDLQRFASQ